MGVRVLVTGAGGLLGHQTARAVEEAGWEVAAFPRQKLDVTDARAVQEAVAAVRPAAVVHCAALTNVDRCELDPAGAWAVNALGARNVARAAAAVGAEVVAVSTDYVFDGTKGAPYAEDDLPNPIQRYGTTKLAGEELVRECAPRHYVVRSAWIYGLGGKNFLSQLFDLAREGRRIRAVRDQRGSPTFAPDLARELVRLVGSGAYGTYHVVNAGSCSFAEFCRFALRAAGLEAEVEEVALGDLGRPAPRPRDTTLAGVAWAGAGFAPLRPWEEAAAAFAAAACSHGPRP